MAMATKKAPQAKIKNLPAGKKAGTIKGGALKFSFNVAN
jgi:hypothetical protein